MWVDVDVERPILMCHAYIGQVATLVKSADVNQNTAQPNLY